MNTEHDNGQQVRSNDLLGVTQRPVAVTWVDPDGTRNFREWNPSGFLLQSLQEEGLEWQTLYPAPDFEAMEFARTASRLLHGFMLDCNAIGAKEAGVNLARGIKGSLAAQQD